MKRPYAQRSKGEVRAFVGKEVEHTPAFGRTTLFLVGAHDPASLSVLLDYAQQEILKSGLPPLSHLFYGANRSFDGKDMPRWKKLIQAGLKEGYWCTLDIPLSLVPVVTLSGLSRYSRFLPLVSVPVPRAEKLGPRATLKIDDPEFDGTNRGVWCVQLSKVLPDPDAFTPWSVYKTDIPLDLDL